MAIIEQEAEIVAETLPAHLKNACLEIPAIIEHVCLESLLIRGLHHTRVKLLYAGDIHEKGPIPCVLRNLQIGLKAGGGKRCLHHCITVMNESGTPLSKSVIKRLTLLFLIKRLTKEVWQSAAFAVLMTMGNRSPVAS